MSARVAARSTRITQAGCAELLRWLTSPQDAPAFRSAQLLRVFLLGELTPVQGPASIWSPCTPRPKASTPDTCRLADSHDWSGGDTDFFARAALEHGLRCMRMEAEWASWVIERFSTSGASAKNVALRYLLAAAARRRSAGIPDQLTEEATTLRAICLISKRNSQDL